ncbi:MAG: ComEC/Rec2 family competence protein [Lachnospiraceae bacterium]|nr:ComEC/Rec2 family competence protein [Lachnospiraceae bacterium]
MKRPLTLMAVCFVCGILWQRFAGSKAPAFLIPAALAAVLFFLFLRSRRKGKDCLKFRALRSLYAMGERSLRVFAFVSVCLFFTAFILSSVSERRKLELAEFEGEKEASLSGRIEDIRGGGDTVRVTLDECRLRTDSKDTDLRFKSLIFLKRDDPSRTDPKKLHVGNVILVRGDMTPFKKSTDPGQFDSFEYYAARGIGASVYPDSIVVLSDEESFPNELIRQVYDYYEETVSRLFEPEDASQLIALTVGDKSLMDEETSEMYRKNGMMHIMAISGLHISIAGLATYRLLRKLKLARKPAGAAAFALALFYCAVTGFSVSAFRALLMMCVLLLAEITGKCYDSVSALSLSLITLLAANPAMISDGGFLLSFGAAFGIAVWLPVFKKSLFAPTVSVYMMILPVMISIYFEFPLYSLFVNLVTAPLMPLVLLFVFLMVALSGLSQALGAAWLSDGLCAVLAGVPHYILLFFRTICSVAESLPFHTVITGAQPLWKIMLYYPAQLLLGLDIRRRKARIKRECCLRGEGAVQVMLGKTKGKAGPGIPATVLFALAAALLLVPVGHADPEAVFLDVGQGDGICLEAGNAVYMVDGGSTSQKKLGKNVLAPFFKHEGAAIVDAWFLTHADRDHISGICDALDRLVAGGYRKDETQEFGISDYRGDLLINRIILPFSDSGFEEVKQKAALVGIGVINLFPGDRVISGDTELVCEAPGAELHSASSNESSLILSVSKDGEGLLLLTGDIGGRAEEELTERLGAKKSSFKVLKVAHHGSRYSSSERFLLTVRGEEPVAVISAAKENRYGHPHKETLERLESAGYEIRHVGEEGALRIVFD